MTAEAALPLPGTTTADRRHTGRRVVIGLLTAAVLAGGAVALRTTTAGDDDQTLTVAQLDSALGIRTAGSHELDAVPDAVLHAALAREARDATALRAAGVTTGSEQRFGVVFRASDRAAAERLVTLLGRTTRFTVALTAPSAATPGWTVGAITPSTPAAVPVAHQLTERMSEAAWLAGGTTFSGWRVLGH